ncbi:hypothetical protein K7432_012836 [Basidiobolus ranarum]|uniref:FAS1 domain-containing protein n=1 Tax=Basidiobolus ranarum TaxID=34480 RepID=A0ABR2WK75_9FUNG
MSVTRSSFNSSVSQEQENDDTIASTSTVHPESNTKEEESVKQTRGYNKSNGLLEVLDRDGRFSRFLKTLSSSSGNFQNDLSNPRNQVTLFAPTDKAFEEFHDRHDVSHEELQRILQYHIIPDIIDEADIKNSDALVTSFNSPELLNEPQRILIERKGNRLYLNSGVKVSEANLEARNGIIHVINEILEVPKSIPAQLKSFSDFSLFLRAIEKSGLEKEFHEPGLTVFVPSNAAFQSLGNTAVDYLLSPEGRKDLRYILLNHISPELIYAGDLKLPVDGRDIRDDILRHDREEFDEDFNERQSKRRENEPSFAHRRNDRNDYDDRLPSKRNDQRNWDNDFENRSSRNGGAKSAQIIKQNTIEKEEIESKGRHSKQNLDLEGDFEALDVYVVNYPSWVHGEKLSLRVLTDYRSSIDITVNRQARIIMADGIAENGVIHVIDRVLLPLDIQLPQLQWHEFNREQNY